MDKTKFNIIMRKPKYPVIVISDEKLYSAFNIKQLAEGCICSVPIGAESFVRVVDSAGEEFWYSPDHYVLSPGFTFKKWTKKKLIDTYNCSSNAKESMREYSTKSLSSKRLEKIIGDICELLRP